MRAVENVHAAELNGTFLLAATECWSVVKEVAKFEMRGRASESKVLEVIHQMF